jgi:uncharacterized protein YlxW (UPF0749 family)
MAMVLAAGLLGFLAVLAATRPAGSPRELRRFELADLVQSEDDRVRALRVELSRLEAEVAELDQDRGDADLNALREEVALLAEAGGSAPLEGPGLVVTLDDSSQARSPSGDPNDLVVHEADIQTVVNALWAAGGEAVAINGERLTAGSAVRCAGNTLLLHGTLHTPPYEIAAIGEPAELSASLAAQPGMQRLADAFDAFGRQLDVESTFVRLDSGSAGQAARVADPVEVN